MRMMRRFLTLVLFLACAAQASAATWNLVSDGDCTGAGAATVASQASNTVMCCTGADVGFCNRRETAGHLTAVRVALVATGSYAAGTDVLFSSTALGIIGLGTIVSVDCDLSNDGASTPTNVRFPMFKRTGATTFLAYLNTATATAMTAASIAGATLNCTVLGY